MKPATGDYYLARWSGRTYAIPAVGVCGLANARGASFGPSLGTGGAAATFHFSGRALPVFLPGTQKELSIGPRSCLILVDHAGAGEPAAALLVDSLSQCLCLRGGDQLADGRVKVDGRWTNVLDARALCALNPQTCRNRVT